MRKESTKRSKVKPRMKNNNIWNEKVHFHKLNVRLEIAGRVWKLQHSLIEINQLVDYIEKDRRKMISSVIHGEISYSRTLTLTQKR